MHRTNHLTTAQLEALRDYSGHVESVERLDTEPSTPQLGMHAVRVTMSSGWTVKLSQYGAVIDEQAPAFSGEATRAAYEGHRAREARELRTAHVAEVLDLVRRDGVAATTRYAGASAPVLTVAIRHGLNPVELQAQVDAYSGRDRVRPS